MLRAFFLRPVRKDIAMVKGQLVALRQEVAWLRGAIQTLLDQRADDDTGAEIEDVTDEVREIREWVVEAASVPKTDLEEFPEPSTHGVPQ